jgi:hypothetical protein
VGTRSELLKEELRRWTHNYIDVNSLVISRLQMERQLQVSLHP